MSRGNGYMAADVENQMFEILASAVKTVGPENFDGRAILNAAESYSQTADGIVRASFSPDKRASVDFLGVYAADGAQKDLMRVDDVWYPVVREP